MDGILLILDAGHGGEDGGAVSITGVPESSINLSVVLKLDQLLGIADKKHRMVGRSCLLPILQKWRKRYCIQILNPISLQAEKFVIAVVVRCRPVRLWPFPMSPSNRWPQNAKDIFSFPAHRFPSGGDDHEKNSM